MRNLKKVLALVLCLVMALSLVTVAGAKSVEDYSDAADVDKEYATGVAVLVGLGIVTGNENEELNPEDPFTRDMLAFLAFCISTGTDAEGAKKLAPMYVEYATANFTDVPADNWAAGAIGYCVKNKIVSGVGDGTFNRSGEVSVAQALLIMLKAAGYTELGTSGFWFNDTVEMAMKKGLLDTIVDNDISKMRETATRQSVMDILFHVMTEVDVVEYNKQTGKYDDAKNKDGDTYTLGKDSYKLAPAASTDKDEWGTPRYSWEADGTPIASVNMEAGKTYTTETTYKKIYSDLKLEDDSVTFKYYIDGVEQTDAVVTKSAGTKVGGDGSTTTVFKSGDVATIVVTNEYLAKVNSVNGKTMSLTVYTSSTGSTSTVYATEDFEYEKDDMLLVNILADKGMVYTATQKDGTATAAGKQTLWINGEAGYVTGKLASVTSDSYTVGGTKYGVQKTLKHNENASKNNDVENAYKWYLGSLGYLIGSVAADNESAADVTCYGVITSIYAELENTKGVKAVLQLSDGSTKTVTLAKIHVGATAFDKRVSAGTKITSTNDFDMTPIYYGDNKNMLTVSTKDLNVSNSTALNVKGATATKDAVANDIFGILGNIKKAESPKNGAYYQGNLFKFVSDDDGIYTAYEVAGTGANEVDEFAGLNNGTLTTASATTATLSVEDACLIFRDAKKEAKKTILLNSATKVMVQNVKTGAVTVYSLDELPGDMELDANLNEVDWVMDGKFASVVYFAGKATDDVTDTYGVFYYNKGAAAINGVDDKKVYTVEGYLDGVKGTYTVKSDVYTAFLPATDNLVGLYAVKLENGVITGKTALKNDNVLSTVKIGGDTFAAGKEGGNEYSKAAKVYIEASKTSGSESRYSSSDSAVNLGGTYRVNEKTKVATGSLSDLASATKKSAVVAVVDPAILTVYSIYITSENAPAPTPTPAPSKAPDAATAPYVDISDPTDVVIHMTAAKAKELSGKTNDKLQLIVDAVKAAGWETDGKFTINKDGNYVVEATKGRITQDFVYKKGASDKSAAVPVFLTHGGKTYAVVYEGTPEDLLTSYLVGDLDLGNTESALAVVVTDKDGKFVDGSAEPSSLSVRNDGMEEGDTVTTGYLQLSVGKSNGNPTKNTAVQGVFKTDSTTNGIIGGEDNWFAPATAKVKDLVDGTKVKTDGTEGTGLTAWGDNDDNTKNVYLSYASATIGDVNDNDDDPLDGVAKIMAVGQTKITVKNSDGKTKDYSVGVAYNLSADASGKDGGNWGAAGTHIIVGASAAEGTVKARDAADLGTLMVDDNSKSKDITIWVGYVDVGDLPTKVDKWGGDGDKAPITVTGTDIKGDAIAKGKYIAVGSKVTLKIDAPQTPASFVGEGVLAVAGTGVKSVTIDLSGAHYVGGTTGLTKDESSKNVTAASDVTEVTGSIIFECTVDADQFAPDVTLTTDK